MKKFFYFAIVLFCVVSCTGKKDANNSRFVQEEDVADSTVYGVCGEGTMMHMLQLITSLNDTVEVAINDEDASLQTQLVGGLMAGDRMAVTMLKTYDGFVAQRIINITSLVGKWSSIDKNFELTEDGEVHSHVTSEANAWTAWRILNGQLLLNRDTFDVITLGADSLELENRDGIFLYKRSRAVALQVDSIM